MHTFRNCEKKLIKYVTLIGMSKSLINIKHIANLARIKLTEEESKELQGEFQSILAYIDEIKEADISHVDMSIERPLVRNVLREDGDEVYSTGSFKEDLLSEAPFRSGDYIKVKKIL
jgi:aspartyl-tRNA(Asn)/glutamyl-tRNA(Gln) amidotransferase subunit C